MIIFDTGESTRETANKRVRTLTVTAMLSAVAAILMLLDFSIPFFPPFLKMDLSDLPALLAAFALGPAAGVAVELIKNIANIALNGTTTAFAGEFANFIVGSALVLPAGLIYKYNKTKKGALYGMLWGIVSMAALGALANYFVLIPIYAKVIPMDKIIQMCAKAVPFIDSMEKIIFFGIIPFNLLKGTLVAVITFALYKRLKSLPFF